MPDRLTRWQWARKKLGASWLEQIVGGLATGLVYYFANLDEELAAVGLGLGVAATITILKLGWHLSRAAIEQERAEHAVLKQEHESLTAQLHAIESRKPRIKTRIDGDGLIVHNTGASARFAAQIRILEESSFEGGDIGRAYLGLWQSPERASAEILGGHEVRLDLGGPVSGPPDLQRST